MSSTLCWWGTTNDEILTKVWRPTFNIIPYHSNPTQSKWYCGLLANSFSLLLFSFINLNLLSFLVIRDWSLNSPRTHLAGDMKYSNGRVTVPIAGRYYIYTQIYFRESSSRILVMVNSKSVTMLHPMASREGTMFAAGVFKLNAGDVIMLKVSPQGPTTVYMSMRHCYFGAYLIWALVTKARITCKGCNRAACSMTSWSIMGL